MAEEDEKGPEPSEVNLDDYVRYHEMANGNFSSSDAYQKQKEKVDSLRHEAGEPSEDDGYEELGEVVPDDDMNSPHETGGGDEPKEHSPQSAVDDRVAAMAENSKLSSPYDQAIHDSVVEWAEKNHPGGYKELFAKSSPKAKAGAPAAGPTRAAESTKTTNRQSPAERHQEYSRQVDRVRGNAPSSPPPPISGGGDQEEQAPAYRSRPQSHPSPKPKSGAKPQSQAPSHGTAYSAGRDMKRGISEAMSESAGKPQAPMSEARRERMADAEMTKRARALYQQEAAKGYHPYGVLQTSDPNLVWDEDAQILRHKAQAEKDWEDYKDDVAHNTLKVGGALQEILSVAGMAPQRGSSTPRVPHANYTEGNVRPGSSSPPPPPSSKPAPAPKTAPKTVKEAAGPVTTKRAPAQENPALPAPKPNRDAADRAMSSGQLNGRRDGMNSGERGLVSEIGRNVLAHQGQQPRALPAERPVKEGPKTQLALPAPSPRRDASDKLMSGGKMPIPGATAGERRLITGPPPEKEAPAPKPEPPPAAAASDVKKKTRQSRTSAPPKRNSKKPKD